MGRLNIHQKAVKRAILSQLELYYNPWEMKSDANGVTVPMNGSERKMHLEEMKMYYSCDPSISFDNVHTTFYWI